VSKNIETYEEIVDTLLAKKDKTKSKKDYEKEINKSARKSKNSRRER